MSSDFYPKNPEEVSERQQEMFEKRTDFLCHLLDVALDKGVNSWEGWKKLWGMEDEDEDQAKTETL
jgi:hypothetical protein